MKLIYEDLQQGDLVKYRSNLQAERGFGIIICSITKEKYPFADPFDLECYEIYHQNDMKVYKVHRSSIVRV